MEHLAEQFSATGTKDKESIKMKQEYEEDVRHQVEESELRAMELRQRLQEQREKEELEKKRREEEIKKVAILCWLTSMVFSAFHCMHLGDHNTVSYYASMNV